MAPEKKIREIGKKIENLRNCFDGTLRSVMGTLNLSINNLSDVQATLNSERSARLAAGKVIGQPKRDGPIGPGLKESQEIRQPATT